jgi:hypothetical protein
MPTYQVTGPDGKKYKVNAPEGASHDDAIAHVKSTYYSSAPESRKDLTFMEKVKDSPVGGFARGLRDVVDGGAQLLTRGLENLAPAVPIVGDDLAKFMKGERERVDQINNEAERDYQQNFRRGNMEGLDVGRLAGNITASLPVAAALPMAAATAPMKARVLAGAVSGGASSALQPVMEQDQGDFLENKLGQVGIGAVTGAASPFIADAIGNVVAKFAGKVKGVPSDANITLNLQGEFSKQGIDFSKLSDQVKASLIADAKKALAAGGKFDPEVLARKADFEELGMNPMLGELLRERNPAQFAFEKNTAGIQGAGEEIAQRLNEHNAKLIKHANSFITGNLDDYAANVAAQQALKGEDAARAAANAALFDTAKNAAGRDLPLSPRSFTDALNKELDFEGLGDFLPPKLRNSMNKIATGEAPFTMQEAQQLLKVANNHFDRTGQQGGMNRALGTFGNHLNRVIDEAGDAAENTLGKEAAQQFRIANQAHRARKQMLENTPALKFAVDNDIPDQQFIQKFVISKNAKPGELLNMRAQLEKQPEIWNEIKSQVASFIKSKAAPGSSDEVAKFSQSGFDRALKQIGDAKLKILFDPKELEQLKRIGRVASFIQVDPIGAAVNHSKSAIEMTNILSRMSGVPYLRELVANPIQNFRMQGQVNSALNPSLNAVSNPTTLDPELVRRLSLPLSVSGYPTVKGLLE